MESLDLSNRDLKDSELVKACGGGFRRLIHVKYLDLSQNQLAVLPEEMFQHLNELEELNCSQNQLATFPVELCKLVQKGVLKTIHFDNNRITDLPTDFHRVLSSMLQLKEDECPHGVERTTHYIRPTCKFCNELPKRKQPRVRRNDGKRKLSYPREGKELRVYLNNNPIDSSFLNNADDIREACLRFTKKYQDEIELRETNRLIHNLLHSTVLENTSDDLVRKEKERRIAKERHYDRDMKQMM